MITDLKINERARKLYYERGYWTDETLADVWERQWRIHADRPYVKDDGGHAYTYREIEERASRLARWLVEGAGVRNGDLVTFQVPKWAEFAIVYVACLKVGAVVHPLATNLSPEDIVYDLTKTDSSVWIVPTFYHKTDYEAFAEEVASQASTVKAILLVDRDRPASDATPYPALSEVLAEFEPWADPAPSASDEVACVLSTSGTTGRPKAVMLTHNNILFSERSYISVLDLAPDDVMWMPSPPNHATGFFHGLISPLLFGGSTVFQISFTAESGIALIQQEGCTWSHGATPFIYDLLTRMDETGEELPSLRFYLCGGAPLPPSTVEWAARHNILLCESYGSTESCPHVYVPLEKCAEWDGQFSGIPFEGIEVRVVDNNHRTVQPGVQGEEASRGPHQFVGYLNEPERTAKALDDEGWFYSGDYCRMDEEGRIRIVGRKKEIIIRGGENISTHEVDQALEGCPGVGDHCTVGMPDRRLGERICTFVIPKGGCAPTVQDAQRYLAAKGVAKRLWPERIEVIDALPRTKTGKIKRYLVSEELNRRLAAES